jgi:SOS-response transcriptional repressor LexA
MPALEDPRKLFQSTCSTNSEPYALQNIGDMMSPEFSENCIIIVDPSMPIHNEAYAIIEFKDNLYFRQYIEKKGDKLLRCINSNYDDIKLDEEFEVRGCIVQQKQRKQKSLHYYLSNVIDGKIGFSAEGKEKTKK